MTITLYEFAKTRSARVRWALQELGVEFISREDPNLIGSLELKALTPTGKLPAIVDNGRVMIESAAICTYLADKYADRGLIPATGTWARAMHEQWVSFILTEVEAHLWSSARNTFRYPKEDRVEAIKPQNDLEVFKSLPLIENNLAHHKFMLGDSFSITDVIVGYTTIWAQKRYLTDDFPKITAYNDMLLEREACPLSLDH